jgi:hypothetical protein
VNGLDAINTILSLVAIIIAGLALWLQRRAQSYWLLIELEIPDNAPKQVKLTIINIGHVSIPISGYGLLDSKGEEFNPKDGWHAGLEGISKSALSPTERLTAYTNEAAIGAALRERGYSGVVKIRAFCRSAEGKYFRSRPLRVDIK